jgi:hypothetical protein
MVGLTTDSRGKVPVKTREKRIRNDNNNNNNNTLNKTFNVMSPYADQFLTEKKVQGNT